MNFTVRYKWALRKDFQEVTAPDPFFPDYEKYLQEEGELLKAPEGERRRIAADQLSRLRQRFQRLTPLADGNPWLQICRDEFKQHILGGLLTSSQSLENILSSTDVRLSHLEYSWDLNTCAWFPQLKTSSSAFL